MKNLDAGMINFSTNEPALQNMHKAFLRGIGTTPEEAPLGKVGAVASCCRGFGPLRKSQRRK